MSYVNLIVFVLDPASRLLFENIPIFQTYPSDLLTAQEKLIWKKDEYDELKQVLFFISTARDPIITQSMLNVLCLLLFIIRW